MRSLQYSRGGRRTSSWPVTKSPPVERNRLKQRLCLLSGPASLLGAMLWFSKLPQIMQAGKESLAVWKENKNGLILWAAHGPKGTWWNMSTWMVPATEFHGWRPWRRSGEQPPITKWHSSPHPASRPARVNSASRVTLLSAVFCALANLNL